MGDSWVVAVNPAAGRRPVSVDRLNLALQAAGVDATLVLAPDAATMRRVVTEAAGEPRLAVVGGDGTINLAVNALFESGRDKFPILGVLPTGTGGDLLRTFAIPQNLEEAAHHLRGDGVYTIDVGELSGTWGVRRFVNVAEAGLGAAAVETAARMPRALGSNRYLAAFGVRLPRFVRTEYELVTDRRTLSGQALAVIMANGQFFGGGWNIAPKAMLVDGELDLQVIDAAKLSAPRMVPKLMKGLHLTDPRVRRVSSPTFRLETRDPWPVEVDGDSIGNTPVEGRVHAAAIDLKI